MKLKIPNGELTLPENFSFEVVQNSAFFSDDGAVSVAATIPATPADLALLNQPARIARQSRYANLFPAVLSQGVFHKSGQLVVASASKASIQCAIALEDSDFYSRYKDQNLKSLFSSKILHTYSTPADWYTWLFRIYTGEIMNDLRIIPVAVNRTEDGYQVNNEPVDDGSDTFPLAHEARIVKEGDDDTNVPDGYGIAPFLLLSAFLEQMFELCGYTVSQNCFATDDDLNRLILLHNCTDVICFGQLDYSDLVPNRTVSEFLEWMRQKFHAQIVCHPSSKSVDIVLLEDILQEGYDYDLTGKLLGDLEQSFQTPSRVVITPDTSLEGAAPAAETIEDLKKKYGSVVEVSENETWPSNNLILRLSTGQYYEARSSLKNIRAQGKDNLIGSDYFTHDRRNTDESDMMSPEDLMPPMVFVNGVLMPYIGERRHRNSSYKNSQMDEDQEIIVVEYAGRSTAYTYSATQINDDRIGRRLASMNRVNGRYFYGTTQAYDNIGSPRSGRYNLTPDELFERFFKRYNKMLRNNLVKVEGRYDIPVEDILSWKMYQLKLFGGQKLLPVRLTYEVGRRVRCLSASFYQVKDYEDSEEDTPTVIPAPTAQWQLNESERTAATAAVQAQNPDLDVISKYDDAYESGEKEIFLTAPTSVGQVSPRIGRTISIGYRESIQGQSHYHELSRADVEVWFVSVAI